MQQLTGRTGWFLGDTFLRSTALAHVLIVGHVGYVATVQKKNRLALLRKNGEYDD